MPLTFQPPVDEDPSQEFSSSIDLLSITDASKYIEQLISKSESNKDMVERMRMRRKLVVDVQRMRESGTLQANQTYIGVRMIEQNIATALPNDVSYLTQPARICVVTPQDETSRQLNVGFLEEEITRCVRYTDWITPFIRTFDGAMLFGNDVLAVLYDESADKPGRVSFHHVEHKNLIFDRRVEDIQHAPIILWQYALSPVLFAQLNKTFGFNPEVADTIRKAIEQSKEDNIVPENSLIYRVFLKKNGLVYQAWYYKSEGTKWLCDPKPFYNGIDKQVEVPGPIDPANPLAMPQPTTEWQPQTMNEYPFFLLRYQVQESHAIDGDTGRGELDHYTQEAATCLTSAYVNGCQQSSNVMWAPDGQDNDGSDPKQLEMKLRMNAIWNKPMKAFTAPYPDPAMLRGLETLTQKNATENNQVAWAVNNRADTRKTAKEIEAAGAQQSMINSVSAVRISVFMQKVITFAFKIIRSQALQGTIPFCQSQPGQNDAQLLNGNFQLEPAGDSDFVQQQQTIANMQQDWPLIQSTPIAMNFLQDYMRLRYPDSAAKYEAAWKAAMIQQAQQAQDQSKQLIAQLGDVIHHLVTSPDGQLKPEFEHDKRNLLQLAQRIQQASAPGGAPPMASGTPNATPPAGAPA